MAAEESMQLSESPYKITSRDTLTAMSRGNAPKGHNGEYVRLPGTPPRSRDASPGPGSRLSPVRQQQPRSPRLAASLVSPPDISSLTQRAEALATQVASLRQLRTAPWPQDQGP